MGGRHELPGEGTSGARSRGPVPSSPTLLPKGEGRLEFPLSLWERGQERGLGDTTLQRVKGAFNLVPMRACGVRSQRAPLPPSGAPL